MLGSVAGVIITLPITQALFQMVEAEPLRAIILVLCAAIFFVAAFWVYAFTIFGWLTKRKNNGMGRKMGVSRPPVR